MEQIFDVFTTREVALAFWLTITLIVLLIVENIRKNIIIFIKRLITIKIIIFYLIPIIYSIFFSFCLYECLLNTDLWRTEYTKSVLFWTFFSGLPLCTYVVSGGLETGYFKKMVLDGFRFTVFVEYLTGLFTFNLFVEIIILPIFSIFFLLHDFTKTEEEYSELKTLFSIIIGFILIGYFAFTGIVAYSTYQSLDIIEVIIGFSIPIILSIMFIPIIYLFALYAKYELIICKMKIKNYDGKNIEIFRIIKIFHACGLSYKKLNHFEKHYIKEMHSGMKENEFDGIIGKFRNELSKKVDY